MLDKRLSGKEIKKEVKKYYSSLVTKSKMVSCCGSGEAESSSEDGLQGTMVMSSGYGTEELQSLPSSAVTNSFGCGNPLAFAGVEEGQTVLDIGSGAGIDCFIAAQKVGIHGKVIGIDMTAEMIKKARENANEGGFSQVEFRLGEAESMPVDSGTIDWVISNCVINLSPDKPKTFEEISRVLKPEGRFSISDIVLSDDLPDWIADNIYAWTGCVAGAIMETDYLQGLNEAGMKNVQVENRTIYDKATIKGFVGKYEFPMETESVDKLLDQIVGKVWSAKITGQKR